MVSHLIFVPVERLFHYGLNPGVVVVDDHLVALGVTMVEESLHGGLRVDEVVFVRLHVLQEGAHVDATVAHSRVQVVVQWTDFVEVSTCLRELGGPTARQTMLSQMALELTLLLSL